MRKPVYMDYQATTPVDPLVVEAMLPFFTEKFGNSASRQHRYGWVADEAVETSRASIAASIGAQSGEIVFTSGSTESNNLALKGAAEILRPKGNHIITVQTEHKSVLDSLSRLEKAGFTVTRLGVDQTGIIDPTRFIEALKPGTILVSVMWVNNEIGTIQDIPTLAALCRSRGILFHTDATQAVGKIPLDVRSVPVDLMSFTAHKLYGPKGTGALYVRNSTPRIRLTMQMDGGGHERGMRSGTLNVPGIVGLAKAVELSVKNLSGETAKLESLRSRLWNGLKKEIDDIGLNGHPERRLPGNLNISFPGVEDSALMMSMKDVAVSTGSACSTADPEPSHVLKAIHVAPERLHSSIRFGLGRFTTGEEIDFVVSTVVESVRSLRHHSPVGHASAT
jgi:cysteine desulfurase